MDGTTGCVLISASCTTGWFDWIHGELWLCPDGILRRSVGLRGTLGHVGFGGLRRTVGERRTIRSFLPGEITSIVGTDRRNRWIRWEDVRHATLKLGIVDHSLHIDLVDGRRAKCLWLKLDGGFDLLEEALGRSLDTRLAVWREPTG